MEQKTPLYAQHVALGGKIVPFGGYLLPVQYPSGILAEHMAVREACGLFDVSHMAEVLFRGPGALATIHHLFTNDFTNLSIGRIRYTPMCNDHGGVVDDLIVYRFAEDTFFAVINAANRDKDVAHMRANLLPDTEFIDLSDHIAQVALQGPKSRDILASLLPADCIPSAYYSFTTQNVTLFGVPCMISRTGYTGSFGYEIYFEPAGAETVWRGLLDAGKSFGLIPCGLGARDTLRLEAGMPLYGHELAEDISPLEAGLDFAVKLQKAEFIGKDALVAAGAPKRVRVGLKASGRGILREHQDILRNGKKIGHITSGTFCPYLKAACAMALVDDGQVTVGSTVEVCVRNSTIPAEVVALPFYRL